MRCDSFDVWHDKDFSAKKDEFWICITSGGDAVSKEMFEITFYFAQFSHL